MVHVCALIFMSFALLIVLWMLTTLYVNQQPSISPFVYLCSRNNKQEV